MRQENDVEKQAAVAWDSVEVPAPRVTHVRAGRMVHEPGHGDEGDEDNKVVQGPDSQRSAHVEGRDRNASTSVLLEEHAVRDEVSTQDEEQLDPLAPEGLQRGPVDVRPGQPLRVLLDVVDEDREARDAAQPVESVKVGWFA